MTYSQRYHPERFRTLHPLARKIATIYQTSNGTGIPTYATLEKIMNLIVKTYNETITELPFDLRPDNLKGMYNYADVAMHYAAFCTFGRQIFHFNPEIAEQFRKTDIDEVRLDSLKFPYEVFYMSFGKQSDLNLWNEGCFVDGAYISMFNTKDAGLQILLTTARENIASDNLSRKFNWILQPEKHYYLALPMEDLSQSIITVVEKALTEEMEDRKKSVQNQPPILDVPGKIVINRRPESIKTEMRELEKGYTVFREALRLIINGLCYISAYPEDIETKWTDDAPLSLLEKLQKAKKPKEVKNTTLKLASMGYTKIHFCGKAFERLDRDSLPTGKEVMAHWRRGHWRNQVCGPKLTSRRLIWIMPVIVRKDKATDLQEKGHIYYIDEDKDRALYS